MTESREDKSAHHPRRFWTAQSWLSAETLESLAELNDQCLDLLREQAESCCPRTGHPLLLDLCDLWRQLDGAARRRAAWCPYLLADAGFIQLSRWAWVHGHHVRDESRSTPELFFSVNPSRAAIVARQVLTYAWHLARVQNSAARLLLGMSNPCAELIASCTLKQITELAEYHPEWLQPRWPGHLRVWRELLTTAISGDTVALEHVRVHGLQLLAAEVRSGRRLEPSPFG